MLLIGLMLVSKNRPKLRIEKIIHTKTQDGKGSIDAHFALAMNHVMRYVNMGNNVISPVQLVYALLSNGGINNEMAELVMIDRKTLNTLLTENASTFKKCDHIACHNEAIFDYEQNSITIF